MICPHCKKSIPKKVAHEAVLRAMVRQADKAMERLEAEGLAAWLARRGVTVYRLAKALGANTSTVQSWIDRGRIPPVPRAAIRGAVMEGRV